MVIFQKLTQMDAYSNAVMTAHMSTPARLDAFQALTKLRYPSDAALHLEAELLATQFRETATERANVVHPIWAIDPKTGEIHRGLVSARGEFRSSFKQHPIESVRVVAEQIMELTRRLTRLYVVAFALEPPYPNGRSAEEVATFVALQRADIDAQLAASVAVQKEAEDNKARKRAHAEASRADPKNHPPKT
jgi:hypothetical protein